MIRWHELASKARELSAAGHIVTQIHVVSADCPADLELNNGTALAYPLAERDAVVTSDGAWHWLEAAGGTVDRGVGSDSIAIAKN